MTTLAAPPKPAGYPIVGLLPEIWKDPLQFFVNAAQLGRVVQLDLGPRRMYLIHHPDDIKYVTQDNARNYIKGYEVVEPVLGQGLVTANGEQWLKQRRLMQPMFHRQKIAGLAHMMTDATQEMLNQWEAAYATPGKPFDVASEMMRLTQTIIVRTMLSADIRANGAEIAQAFTDMLEYLNTLMFSPVSIPLAWPTPINLRFKRAIALIESTIYGILRDRRASGRDENDLVSMLMEARDETTGEGMSDKQIRDELVTIFFAGHETTASTLSWAWYTLAQHPTIYRQLESEIDSVLGTRLPTVEDLPRLTFTRQVIDETLRLYPPAWMFAKVAVNEDAIAGYRIPAGAQIMLSPYVTHRQPEFWEAPNEFRPNRFAPGADAGRAKLAYFPFSAGPRKCIGDQFALVEATLLLAAIAQRYRMRLVPNAGVKSRPTATLRPFPGVLVTIEKR